MLKEVDIKEKEEMEIKEWVERRIKEADFFILTRKEDKNFIDEEKICELLEKERPDPKKVDDILKKSLEIKTLDLEELATLINIKDKSLWQKLYQIASEVKKKVYDNRIVTFAPLYCANFCVNNCLYCGFRAQNKEVKRKKLSLEEIEKEVEVLTGKIGHKRLIVVYGEHSSTDINYMVQTIRKIYEVKVKTRKGISNIRRVNVNAPPLNVEELRLLKSVGIGTYQVFQETYNKKLYEKLHPKGDIKHNYYWRLYCMHRAFEAGIDDVGIGVLFGLYDWRFEVMALLSHAKELESCFGIGPHTVSFPRLRPAFKTKFYKNAKYKVSDEDFKKIITLIRLSIPYTGLILTAREPVEIRDEAFFLGITQTDASTKIGIGSYSQDEEIQSAEKQQFLLADTRSLDELIKDLAKKGFITSFCTAGYRCQRTGKCIMELLRKGKERWFCKLNAVLTFEEWLDDFSQEETKRIGEQLIKKEIEEIKIQIPQFFPQFMDYCKRTEKGERDLYF